MSLPRKRLYLEECSYFFLAHVDAKPEAQILHLVQIQLLIFRSTSVLPVHLLPKSFPNLEVTRFDSCRISRERILIPTRYVYSVSVNFLDGAVIDGNDVFFLSGSRVVVEHEVRVSYYYMRPALLQRGYSVSVPILLRKRCPTTISSAPSGATTTAHRNACPIGGALQAYVVFETRIVTQGECIVESGM